MGKLTLKWAFRSLRPRLGLWKPQVIARYLLLEALKDPLMLLRVLTEVKYTSQNIKIESICAKAT